MSKNENNLGNMKIWYLKSILRYDYFNPPQLFDKLFDKINTIAACGLIGVLRSARGHFTHVETIAEEELQNINLSLRSTPSSLWTDTCTLLYHTEWVFKVFTKESYILVIFYDKNEIEGYILT